MAIATHGIVGEFVDAIVARDLARARGLLHDEIDFRAMTPNRIWEADGPADVENALRQWLADPDEEIDGIEATDAATVEDTARVGWRVRGSGDDGPFVFEQQAYARERDGRIAWLRVFCTGQRPPEGAA
jgi:ketosteroid isomerase-like protein